ncbi:MAG TPA: hypothetical protein VGB73_09740 [Pyrinomonadaceae bacterium]|jgi:hypothetical protein
MKSRLSNVAALLVVFGVFGVFAGLGTLETRAQSGVEPEERPFQISSRGTPFGLQGEFEGTYRVYDYTIEVSVRKATFYVSEHCPYKGRRAINYLKFSLAKEIAPGGRWDTEKAARALELSLVLKPGDEFALYDLHFTLPKEPETDLSTRWLVVAMQEDALDVPRKKDLRGYSFAHSSRDVFSTRSETARR